jgi:hypothetical protein
MTTDTLNDLGNQLPKWKNSHFRGVMPTTVRKVACTYSPKKEPAGTPLRGGADDSMPTCVFNNCVQTQPAVLPIHDHRDNSPTAGGFAFSIYHPGCALPQPPWSI